MTDCVWNGFQTFIPKTFPCQDQLLKKIQYNTKEIATKLVMTSFVASYGWLQKWQSRYNISFKAECGEAADVCEEDGKRKTGIIVPSKDLCKHDRPEKSFIGYGKIS